MYLECLLVFKSYKPLKLEKGMLFYTGDTVREITSVPLNQEEFISINGYPVEMFIVDPGNPNIFNGTIIATPEQIGWFDEGEHSDELSDISVKNINDIIEYDGGYVDVEMTQDEDGEYVPLLYQNKITIRMVQEFDDSSSDDESWDNDEAYAEWEENNNSCNVCKGSGEGSYDGSSCTACGGTGRGR